VCLLLQTPFYNIGGILIARNINKMQRFIKIEVYIILGSPKTFNFGEMDKNESIKR